MKPCNGVLQHCDCVREFLGDTTKLGDARRRLLRALRNLPHCTLDLNDA
jgi:hypothetical protein